VRDLTVSLDGPDPGTIAVCFTAVRIYASASTHVARRSRTTGLAEQREGDASCAFERRPSLLAKRDPTPVRKQVE